MHSDGFPTETVCNPQFKLKVTINKKNKFNLNLHSVCDKERFKTLLKQSLVCTVHST